MPNAKLNLSLEDETPTAAVAADGKVEAVWPVIYIDDVEGLPAFETVTVNGTVHQIRRTQDVCVGPAVIGILKNCIGKRYVKVEDTNGRVRSMPQEYSTIPWRQVGTQKVRIFPKEVECGHQIYFGTREL